jgi:hypothetical protein
MVQGLDHGFVPHGSLPLTGIGQFPVGAAEGCDLLILIFNGKVKRSQPSAAPTGECISNVGASLLAKAEGLDLSVSQ